MNHASEQDSWKKSLARTGNVTSDEAWRILQRNGTKQNKRIFLQKQKKISTFFHKMRPRAKAANEPNYSQHLNLLRHVVMVFFLPVSTTSGDTAVGNASRGHSVPCSLIRVLCSRGELQTQLPPAAMESRRSISGCPPSVSKGRFLFPTHRLYLTWRRLRLSMRISHVFHFCEKMPPLCLDACASSWQKIWTFATSCSV